ncbi:hypothetical protein AN396_04080 [Candidatus Epulonipiscium fishelsonii]|uniref:Uncharacterized protein n=1 Tax=Candidatus Epulonipiscium fishelsonii TaxID=77094 RepID=A0ACC8XE11_9FIRM|nr:hypothetical protein AN396_04080 [Epulopiscium sp. SCG-B11WGA-EpuloA1]
MTGLLGDGRSEVFEAVFGVSSGHSGKIIIKGKEANITSTAKALSLGILGTFLVIENKMEL